MADQKPLTSMKKTFFYKFFPSKAEEEACKVNNTPWVVTRELREIRDKYPAPIIHLENPWQIKKKITRDELVLGRLEIPFFEAFEYIFRYWELPDGNSFVNGIAWNVVLWDVTEENNPKKYDGASVRNFRFMKLSNDDYCLKCIQLGYIGIQDFQVLCSSYFLRLMIQEVGPRIERY